MRYLYVLWFLFTFLYAESSDMKKENFTILGMNIVKELKGRGEYDKWLPMYKTIQQGRKEIFLDENVKSSLRFISDEVSHIAVLNIIAYKIYTCKIYESELCIDFRVDIKKIIKGKFEDTTNIILCDNYQMAEQLESFDMIVFMHKVRDNYYQVAEITAYRDADKNYINYLMEYNKPRRTLKLYNTKYKSLYDFCQTTGIKESEIRALNPWINKKATNIPPNAEIIIPHK